MTGRIAVLVSVGRHPQSARARRAEFDARALELALRLRPAELEVIHAGQADQVALRDYLGMGLASLTVVEVGESQDPVRALAAYFNQHPANLILTGTAAVDGLGSGLLPYRLAALLELPLLANVAQLSLAENRLIVTQALERGQRRRLAVNLPAIVTVGSAAPQARQSAFAKARRGTVNVVANPGPAPRPNIKWSHSKSRPLSGNLRTVDSSASAAERLAAITQPSTRAGSAAGTLVAGLTHEAAAARLLEVLRARGVVPPSKGHAINQPEPQ